MRFVFVFVFEFIRSIAWERRVGWRSSRSITLCHFRIVTQELSKEEYVASTRFKFPVRRFIFLGEAAGKETEDSN